MVWQTSSPSVGVSHHAVCTSIVGSAIGLDVLVGAILFSFQLLRRLQISCYFCTRKNISTSLQLKGNDLPERPCFKYNVPELLDSFVLRDLILSFEIERPCRHVGPPSWDLVKVLTYLRGSAFEPLSSKPSWIVTMKVSFLLALATAKRMGELRALYFRVASRGPDFSLAYLPEFVAKTGSERNPLP